MSESPTLTRREREVMDIVHGMQRATVAQILEQMQDPPSNSAIRSVLRILVNKGHLAIEQDGPRYVYLPTESLEQSRQSALGHVLHTFFGGSVQGVITALLERQDAQLNEKEQERIKAMIDQAAKEGR